MSRFLYTLAALVFLVVAVLSLFQGRPEISLAASVVMLVMFVLAVLADRSGEGMPSTPPTSSP
jgi:FtsH-binding integral membrane protein